MLQALPYCPKSRSDSVQIRFSGKLPLIMTTIFARNDKLENGHYVVIKELGVGGMGVVYHCRDAFLQRDVAIKMLLPDLMKDANSVKVFTQEAQLAAHLEHPNIVTVYDIGEEERNKQKHHFVAMEYLPGGTLARKTQGGPLPIEHSLNWMKQLANGLNFAHRRGVVHQDIKADNILITTEGDLKIGDFGLARLMANKVYINPTTKGMGTPAYMSPELCRGEQQDHRSDIYSLGVLFFEMATGQLPYRANGMIEMAMKHTTAPIPSVRRLNPRVPDQLDRLIRKMMEKSPDDRYQSLAEVLSKLDDFIFELRVARMGLSTPASPQDDQKQITRVDTKETSLDVASVASVQSSPEPELVSPPPSPRNEPAPRAYFSTVSPGETDKKQTSPAVDPGAITGEYPIVKPSSKQQNESSSEKTPGDKTPPPPSGNNRKDKSNEIFSDSTIRLAGIKVPEQVGPARQPTVQTKKFDPVVSAYEIPVLSDLKPVLLKKWSFETAGPIGWNSRPVVSQDLSHIYVASTDGALYKLSAKDGNEIWKFGTKSILLSSPVVRGADLIQACADGQLIKINSASGERIWKKRLPAKLVSTPVLAGNSILLSSTQGQLWSIDGTSGDILWERKLDGALVAGLRNYGNITLIGSRQGNMYCLDTKSGNIRWHSELDGSIVSLPATSADSLYIGTQSGNFYSLDIDTGQVLWEYQTTRGIISSAQIAFTSVVFCSQDKWLYCCEKYDGHLRWKAAVRGNVQTGLSLAAKSILATSREGWMQGFSAETGELRWQRHFGCRLESMPLVLRDALLVADVNGVISYFVFNTDQLECTEDSKDAV
jgi:serine/threonine protein kinase